MDLRDLRYFETIAQLQHLGRAAEVLHRTQPTLSGCIRRLEEECGAPLFEKDGRGIRLTSAGRVLYKWAQRMRVDVDDAKREIANVVGGLSGHVRIGVVQTAAQFLLPPAARKLMAEAPGVTFKTVVGVADTLLPLLQAGEIDLMVATEIPIKVSGVISQTLLEDCVVVVASARHPLFNMVPSMEDLTRYRWLLQPVGAPPRDWLDLVFDRRQLPRPDVQFEVSVIVLPALILDTGLLSFVPRHHISASGPGAELKEVVLEATTMHRKLTVTYRDNEGLPPAARRLIELLTQTAA